MCVCVCDISSHYRAQVKGNKARTAAVVATALKHPLLQHHTCLFCGQYVTLPHSGKRVQTL